MVNLTLSWKYELLCKEKWDINEHLPTLRYYASQCNSIVEMWVRDAISTVALLHWLPKDWVMLSIDLNSSDWLREVQWFAIKEKRKFKFHQWNNRWLQIEPTDMLFIDTLHDYAQLKYELRAFANKVKKYIILHDTVTFWIHWETEGKAWLGWAVQEFLMNHPDREYKQIYTNNNWLSILERYWDVDEMKWKSKPLVTVYTAIYWDKDYLRLQPKQTMNTRFVCFTDNPDIEYEKWARQQREIIVDAPYKHLHPRMQAKRYRMHPSKYFDTPIVIRMDWVSKLLRNDSVEKFVSELEEDTDILCFKHPERDCIYDEADFSFSMEKYLWQPWQSQAAHYKTEWFPEHYWLTWTWLLVSRIHNSKIKSFFEKRRHECLLRSYQDQISFDYLVRKTWIKRSRFNIEWTEWYNNYIDFKWWHNHNE